MNSSLLAALIASGATSTTVPSAWREALVAAGAADGQLSTFLRQEGYSGSVADSFFKYLGDKGYIGSLSDRISAASAASDLFAIPTQYITWDTGITSVSYTYNTALSVTKDATVWHSVRSLLGVQTGKIQVDFGVMTEDNPYIVIGLMDSVFVPTAYMGASAGSIGWVGANGTLYNEGSPSSYGGTLLTGNRLQLLIDFGAQLMYPRIAGVTQGSGISFAGLSGDLYCGMSLYYSGRTNTVNFGASTFPDPVTNYTGWELA